uniref:Phospholipase A2 n=2 Tax=Parascaris univalens TaxID=6257 RepID=A0A915AVB3_PARUN
MTNLFIILMISNMYLLVLSTRNGSLKALWNLEEMCKCKLDYSALVYVNYGCWCGIGGAGEPIDGIDRCCMLHDKCYDAAIDKRECFDVPFEYIDDYSWNCVNKEPICRDDMNVCKSALCLCDKAVVDCWAQFAKPAFKRKCNRTKPSLQGILSRFLDSTDR